MHNIQKFEAIQAEIKRTKHFKFFFTIFTKHAFRPTTSTTKVLILTSEKASSNTIRSYLHLYNIETIYKHK